MANKLTIEQLIKRSIQQLDLAHSYSGETAKLDVEILLAHVLGVNIPYFYTWPEKELSTDDIEQFLVLLNQRMEGKPIAYILGYQAFWAFDLEVSDSTLIPRADTEILVETGLALIDAIEAPKVLDLGTGTGAVALALAYERKKSYVEAVDLVEDAVALAKRNNEKLGLNVQIQQSNWFASIQTNDFNLIVANPPYIDPQDHHLDQGDLRFEPRTALISDKNGYADIELIADQARQYLKSGGWLAFEHGFEQGNQARHILAKYGYQSIETRKDYGGNDRVTLGAYFK
ncbi:peptide chain release factor N(5)-glutamine methyltransferase [Marinomonas agarivorans]|nr:peptide chain release factor N(5)-glutamine methyltransferase [Marinomonas agarivorans]